MNERRDLISMLEDAGSTRLPNASGHVYYRLPNGRRICSSGTASDHRSYANAIAIVRRELKDTHPEIANRGRALPKSKRKPSNTLGDMLHAKGIEIVKKDILEEADCEILPPEPPPVEEVVVYAIPRAHAVLQPRPSRPKTLTPEQLTQANRILQDEGEASMNRYLNECRDGLIDTSRELVNQRRSFSIVSPENRVPASSIANREENEMTSVLERARLELHATEARVLAYNKSISELTEKRDADLLRQVDLETYITKHEELASNAARLISDVLPPLPAEPVSRSLAEKKPKQKSNPEFGIKQIRATVYPALKMKEVAEFGVDDVMKVMQGSLGDNCPKRGHVHQWMESDTRNKKPEIMRVAPGRYRFTSQDVVAVPAPVETQHHAYA